MAKRQITKHHCIPQSRIKNRGDKDTDNIVLLNDRFHRAWHDMFENLTPNEAIEMIRIVMVPGTHWNYTDLKRLRNKLRRK